MGFCAGDDKGFDVFFSYSRDDDSYHNHWVSDFEKYLNDKVIAQLKRQGGAWRDDAQAFRICRDETGFPASGDLQAVIDDKVRSSHLLIIFLGQGYLNSTWCLSELDIFRETAGGTLQEAVERLYLIVLDSKAVDRLNEGDEPGHLLGRRKNLWRELQSLSRTSIRVEDFLYDGKLLPVFRKDNRADTDFHNTCTRLVDEITNKLIAYRGRRVQMPPPPPAGQAILLGVVPQRLAPARNQLMRALGDTQLRAIELADLGDRERLRTYLADARVLVQPFDAYQPIIRRGDPPGGHLAVQQKLLEALRDTAGGAPDCPLIWWEPRDADSTPGDPIDDYDKHFFDTLPHNSKRKCTAQELAAELRGSPGAKAPEIASVWIEWEESDQDTIDAAKEIVYQYFSEHCAKQEAQGRHLDATLKFGDADWWNLEQELSSAPDGVVIVYSEHKDRSAFIEQTRTISNLEAVLLKKTFPGIFYMLEKGRIRPTDDWSVVRFRSKDHELEYKRKEVEEFVANLFDVLWKNYH